MQQSLRLSINLLVREHPRLPLTRELSATLTEGEKMFRFYATYRHIGNF